MSVTTALIRRKCLCSKIAAEYMDLWRVLLGVRILEHIQFDSLKCLVSMM